MNATMTSTTTMANIIGRSIMNTGQPRIVCSGNSFHPAQHGRRTMFAHMQTPTSRIPEGDVNELVEETN